MLESENKTTLELKNYQNKYKSSNCGISNKGYGWLACMIYKMTLYIAYTLKMSNINVTQNSYLFQLFGFLSYFEPWLNHSAYSEGISSTYQQG